MVKPREHWRHLALLISILFLFIISPAVSALRYGALILEVIAAAALIVGSYAVSERKLFFIIALALSGIAIVLTWLLLIVQWPWIAILSHGCLILLIAFFSIIILGYVLRSGRVTTDRIFASVCVYLLIGYAWTFAYVLVEELQPASFIALSYAAPNDYVSRVLQMRYFSFITLTTVGYGDIVPHSSWARTLSVLEAITGQIYLTVLVARLVGLHIVHAQTDASRED
jgi:hypothetical protein